MRTFTFLLLFGVVAAVGGGACASSRTGESDLCSTGTVLDMTRYTFLDILNRTYRCDYASRDNAFAAFREEPLPSLTPLVREIARMQIAQHDEQKHTLDFVAVQDALFCLTLVRDEQAAELNLARLEDRDVSSGAVPNLTRLKHWSAKPRVLRLLSETPPEPASLSLLRHALEFMAKAPGDGSTICAELTRLAPLARDCSTKRVVSMSCQDFVEFHGAVSSRYGCDGPAQP